MDDLIERLRAKVISCWAIDLAGTPTELIIPQDELYPEAAAEIERLRAECEALRMQRDIAMHDLKQLQDQEDAKGNAPTPMYGQCAACGIFSSQAKGLHDAQRRKREGDPQ